MKIQLFIFSILILGCVYGCVKDHPKPQVLKLSEQSLRFSGRGGSWQLTVNSNCNWQVSGNCSWCQSDKTEGFNTDKLLITVDSNDTHSIRSTEFTLKCDQKQLQLSIQQDTANVSHHYQLPVIFHVLYSNANDTVQMIDGSIVPILVDRCNSLYNQSANSADMNLELIAATEDPQGNPLAETGVERILLTTSGTMSCNKFMDEKNSAYVSYLWDPNRYINVFVYTFQESNVTGISHLPYTPYENSLTGLQQSNYYFSNLPKYAHCISLNNTYLQEKDAYVTLAHELGHYLGLYHVFSEKECEETDYCDDTPNYNRTAYLNGLAELTPPYNFQEVVQRTSCEGLLFISTNIMDYYYSYQNQFTENQRARVRHVLENSPLVPGPKNIVATKARADDTIPEVRYIE